MALPRTIVKAAVLGVRERGSGAALVADAIAGVDAAASSRALDEMRAAEAEMSTLTALG